LCKSGDFKSFFLKIWRPCATFAKKKSFVKVALDYFLGRQVAKIRQKIKRTGTTIHQNIENKKSIVVAL
jgi:hypothetical protein